MIYKITWREFSPSFGWYVHRKALVDIDGIRVVLDALRDRKIYAHRVQRVNR